MTIGIGLIGYGGIGRLHALCLRMLPLCYPDLPPIRLVAVQTASANSAARVRQELGEDVIATTSLHDLLANPDIQVIDCCAPTGDHAAIALASFAASKAFFCEKPLAGSLDEAEGIVAAAEMAGCAGGVNFHFRQVPALQEARRLVANGLLGEPIGFHLRYYRSSNLKRDRPITWRFRGPGSGVLVDLGAHMIDQLLTLLGPVAWLSARTRILVPERRGPDGAPVAVESDDVAWLSLGMANGAVGSIEVSKLVPGASDDIRIEVYGSGGSLLYDSRDPNTLTVVEGANSTSERRLLTLSRTQPAASLPAGDTPAGVLNWHMASLYAFLNAYHTGKEPNPSLIDGLEVDRVIAVALRSAAHAGQIEVLA